MFGNLTTNIDFQGLNKFMKLKIESKEKFSVFKNKVIVFSGKNFTTTLQELYDSSYEIDIVWEDDVNIVLEGKLSLEDEVKVTDYGELNPESFFACYLLMIGFHMFLYILV